MSEIQWLDKIVLLVPLSYHMCPCVSIEAAEASYIRCFSRRRVRCTHHHDPSFCPSPGPHVEEPGILAVQLVAGMAQAFAAQARVPVPHANRQHVEDAAD